MLPASFPFGRTRPNHVSYTNPPHEQGNIFNDTGEVALMLPSQSSFEVSAESRSGEVENDFEGPSLKTANDEGTGRLYGTFDSRGTKITIVTCYGTIYLGKSHELSATTSGRFYWSLAPRRRSRIGKNSGNDTATQSASRITVSPSAPRAATASAMAMRWSPRGSIRAPRIFPAPRPSTRIPSGNSSTRAPIRRKPSASVAMRSLSFTRNSSACELFMPL